MRLREPSTARQIVFSMLVAGVLLGAAACASGAGGSSRSSRFITQEELEENPGLETAYQAIQRLRPQWLRPRNQGTFTSGGPILPQVVVDNVPYGELETLNSFSVRDILEMEFVSASAATTRFGTGYMGGAIMVTTR